MTTADYSHIRHRLDHPLVVVWDPCAPTLAEEDPEWPVPEVFGPQERSHFTGTANSIAIVVLPFQGTSAAQRSAALFSLVVPGANVRATCAWEWPDNLVAREGIEDETLVLAVDWLRPKSDSCHNVAPRLRNCSNMKSHRLLRLTGVALAAWCLVLAASALLSCYRAPTATKKTGADDNQSTNARLQPDSNRGERATRTNTYQVAREQHELRLATRGPAPGPTELGPPPPGVQAITYESGDLELQAWVTEDPRDGLRHPAVVFLHPNFSLERWNWRVCEPFVQAGFVVMAPTFRGENGNPGVFEYYLGEVDDAIAAGVCMARLPYVDPDQVYLCGYSTGGSLAALVALLPSPYRAAASFDGALNRGDESQVHEDYVPVLSHETQERRIRSAVHWAANLTIPLELYLALEASVWTLPAARRYRDAAAQSGRDVSIHLVAGDHSSMLSGAMDRCVAHFLSEVDANPSSDSGYCKRLLERLADEAQPRLRAHLLARMGRTAEATSEVKQWLQQQPRQRASIFPWVEGQSKS